MAEQLTFDARRPAGRDVRELRRRAQCRGGRHARAPGASRRCRDGARPVGRGGRGKDASAEGGGRARARPRSRGAVRRRSVARRARCAPGQGCARGRRRRRSRRRARARPVVHAVQRARLRTAASSSLRPSVPPARMALRDDLRTRLGWGLVFEIVPLDRRGEAGGAGERSRTRAGSAWTPMRSPICSRTAAATWRRSSPRSPRSTGIRSRCSGRSPFR